MEAEPHLYKYTNMKKLFLNSLVAGFILLSSCEAQSDFNLDAQTFFDKTNNDTVQILDVRTPGEYNSGYIKNAMLADWNAPEEFDRRTQFLNKNRPIYIYCLSGGRSGAAAKKLRTEGYTVYELNGGIIKWKSGKFPLTGTQSDKSQQSLASFLAKTEKGTVLVDFGASWCPPCRAMEPVIEKVRNKKGSALVFVQVDGGKDQEIMNKFQVSQLPVFIIFKEGKQVWRKDGIASEEELLSNL